MRGLLNFPSQIDQESTEDLTPAQSAKFIPPVEDAATRCPVGAMHRTGVGGKKNHYSNHKEKSLCVCVCQRLILRSDFSLNAKKNP